MSIVDEEVQESVTEQTEEVEESTEVNDEEKSETEVVKDDSKSFTVKDILFLLFAICFIGVCLYGVNMVFNAHDYSNTDFMNIFMR